MHPNPALCPTPPFLIWLYLPSIVHVLKHQHEFQLLPYQSAHEESFSQSSFEICGLYRYHQIPRHGLFPFMIAT